jgi:hypothetical protein
MVVTFPVLTVTDDSGAIVTGATVTITSVRDKNQVDIVSHGAIVNAVNEANVLTGADLSIDYDAEAKGDAWITLAVSKVGSTFTGLNAAPRIFVTRDSGRILSTLPDIVIQGTVSDPVPTAGAFEVNGGLLTPSYAGKKLVFQTGVLKSIFAPITSDPGGALPRPLTFFPPFPLPPAQNDQFIIIG